MTDIALAAGAWRMALRPGAGGLITRLDHGDRPVLRPMAAGQDDPLAASSFPLVPYANRIAHGRFRAQGRDHRLPRNFGDHPHSLHGLGWHRPWTVEHQDATSARFLHRHDGGAGWPWRYRAEQRLALGPAGLKAQITLTNEDTEAMPAGLGFHPYFACGAETRVRFLSAAVWDADADCLPTQRLPADYFGDWTDGAPIRGDTLIDHAYDGWRGSVWIDHGDGARYHLTATGAPWLHLYRPPGLDFFCAEPVSHGPDAINRGGMPLLAPGEAQVLTMRISAGD
ncbi:aldose 1-epimerase [Sphingobium sufflavum]|uniref:aldose 1-epimerase n=1 Tax=Sphingobium sufflavum TaxID=1129547 RepID=UPI001F16984D|nr:aldose 1-epimerase [Sphingobium sufflavum]MCE7797984.1 aldose 1-epimerase [Sphingobium sufflavum]